MIEENVKIDDGIVMMRDVNPRIKALYDACFPQDPAWNGWFFENVLRDEDVYGRVVNGNLVSMMLAQRYDFGMCDKSLPVAYISGVCTDIKHREKGHLHALMGDVLASLYSEGYSLAGLVPAHDRLFFFYDGFGFATSVYVDTMRYVDGHIFEVGEYGEVETDYGMFRELESDRGYAVIHTEEQFGQLCKDAEMDGGKVFAVRQGASCAVAVAVPSVDSKAIVVKDLLTSDDQATQGVLHYVTEYFGRLPMSVYSRPTDRKAPLNARGMLRIINVEAVLGAVASMCKHEQVIRVHDRLIPENNGVYILHAGKCEHIDRTIRHLTLDVDVAILTEILFSAPWVGDVFDLPTSRPMLPLMLD